VPSLFCLQRVQGNAMSTRDAPSTPAFSQELPVKTLVGMLECHQSSPVLLATAAFAWQAGQMNQIV